MWLARDGVDLVLVDLVVCCCCCLENVQSSSHVSSREFEEGGFSSGSDVHTEGESRSVSSIPLQGTRPPFAFNYNLQPLLHFHLLQRRKPESRASTLNRRSDLPNVIADDTEPDVLGVLLDYSSKSSLCGSCHLIRFIQDDEFVRGGEESACFGELANEIPDGVDAAFIRGVELEEG
jgi:hypothetical protein